MKTALIVFIVLLIPFLFTISCKKKCKESEIASFTFSPKDKSLIPYRGDELLVLTYNHIPSNYDSLKGTGRFDDYDLIYKPSGNECNDYYSLEFNKYSFPTKRVNYSALLIQLSQEFTNPLYSYGQKYFFIAIGATYQPGCFYSEMYQFNNDSIFVNNSNVYYYDSITIGTQKFYKIYKLKPQKYPSNVNEYFTEIYYSVRDGIKVLKDNRFNTIYVNKSL